MGLDGAAFQTKKRVALSDYDGTTKILALPEISIRVIKSLNL